MSRESLIARLQTYRKQAEANHNFVNLRDNGERGKPYFRKYPPEVQVICWEFYNSLYLKHGHKLLADSSYQRILVAVATRLALDKLGITQISRKGFHRMREINRVKVGLGIRDKSPDQVANNRRKRAAAIAKMQERDVPPLSHIR